MIINDQQYRITQERIAEFRAALAKEAATPDPDACSGVTTMLTRLEREAAMWEAGIHEPVPGDPPRVDLGLTIDEVNAMDEATYTATSRRVAIATKQAEIANIDAQIAILLDRIADWRRHRAWLEREIAELDAEVTEPQPQHSRAG